MTEAARLIRSQAELADLARQLVVEQVPEGLRIQILDADRQPMFSTGSTAKEFAPKLAKPFFVATMAGPLA